MPKSKSDTSLKSKHDHALHPSNNSNKTGKETMSAGINKSMILPGSKDEIKIEILYRVSETQKKQILNDNPGLSPSVFIKDNKTEQHPFKIVLGKGTFSKVRLGRYHDKKQQRHYVAIRKIKSEEALGLSQKNFSREQAVAMTLSEIKLQQHLEATLTDSELKQHLSLAWKTVSKLSKSSRTQLYQFIPLSDIGDGNAYINLLAKEKLNKDEQIELFEYIARTLLCTVSKLNDANIFHRDIKPANTLFSTLADPKLADLGSAIIYESKQHLEASSMQDLAYMPPFNLLAIHLQKTANDLPKDPIRYDADLDSWALALTLLQLWSLSLGDFVQQRFLALSKHFMQTIKTQTFVEILTSYQAAYAALLGHEDFIAIPTDIRQVIMTILEDKLNPDLAAHQSLSKILHATPQLSTFSSAQKSTLTLFKKLAEARIEEATQQENDWSNYEENKPTQW
jgi:serine/threonine protein kinase